MGRNPGDQVRRKLNQSSSPCDRIHKACQKYHRADDYKLQYRAIHATSSKIFMHAQIPPAVAKQKSKSTPGIHFYSYCKNSASA